MPHGQTRSKVHGITGPGHLQDGLLSHTCWLYVIHIVLCPLTSVVSVSIQVQNTFEHVMKHLWMTDGVPSIQPAKEDIYLFPASGQAWRSSV